MSDSVIGYHFAGNTLRDGSPLPKAGDPLPELNGTRICQPGMYHCSTRAIDALTYAPGPCVAIVRVYQNVATQDDKAAGQRRDTLTDYVDASEALSDSARLFARQVAHAYPGEMDRNVIRWLWDGDMQARSAAYLAQNIALEMRLNEVLRIVSLEAMEDK